MSEPTFNGDHVFTRSVQAASSLIAIGARLREPNPVTVTRALGKPDDVLFWFQNGEIACGGCAKPAAAWLTLFLCPWKDFDLSLDHPAAFLKAAAENRQILVAGAKKAGEQPFRVIQRGNRVAVLGAGVSETNAKRLFNDA